MQHDPVAELLHTDGVAPPTIALHGEIDIHYAPQLDACLQEAMKAAPSEIVVDMAALRFIDSSGLKALVLAAKVLGENGGRVVITNPPKIALRVLEISGLAGMFRIQKSGSEATRSECG